MNKVDLLPDGQARLEHIGGFPTFWLSAKNNLGLSALRQGIKQILGVSQNEAGFTARARHVAGVERALSYLLNAQRGMQMGEATEIIAEELSAAHQALGEIVGTVTPDDLLGRIFSEFCIGK